MRKGRSFGFIVCWMALCVVACNRAPSTALPPIPAFDTEGYLPVIQQQINGAERDVNKKPRDATANAHFAQVLQAYAQFEPAVDLYTRAAALDRRPGVWLYLKGQSLAALGRTDEAVEALGMARKSLPKDPWIASAHTLMRRMSGDRTATAADLDDILAANPRLPELRYARARLHVLEGDLEPAIDQFELALDLAGPFGAAYYGLGMAQMRLGAEEEAAESLALSQRYKDVAAQGSDPHLAAVDALNLSDIRLIRRAEKALRKGDLSNAAALLTTAVERNPGSVAAHLSLMGVHSNLKNFAKAETHYEAARALEPERAKLFYNLGLLRLLQNRYVEAERAFTEALERERNADTYVQLGIVQRAQKRFQQASFSLGRALKLDSEHRIARLQLAQIHRQNRDLDGVVTALEGHYAPADSSSANMLLLLARAYNELEQYDNALSCATLGLEAAQTFGQLALVNQLKRQHYLAIER